MQPPQYVLPKVGISTNQMQLKLGQQRLLQQNYNKQLPLHNSQPRSSNLAPAKLRNKLSELNPFQSDDLTGHGNSFSSRSFSQPRLAKNIHQEIIRNSLNNQLMQQIALKEQFKKYQKRQQLALEQQMVRHNKVLQSKELLKQRQFRESYRQQANMTTSLHQLTKQNQKLHQTLEKQTIGQTYRSNHETIKKRMEGSEDFQVPSQLYLRNRVSQTQLGHYRDIRVNPESMGLLLKKSMHRPNREESGQLLKNLKETLLEQMKNNAERKRNEKVRQWNTPFIEQRYKQLDNPIVNPVDIKIAKDNPYLMKELLGRKSSIIKGVSGQPTMGSGKDTVGRNSQGSRKGTEANLNARQQSYLSRRGSHSLARLGY